MSFGDQTMHQFLEGLGSPASVPNRGAASAVVGAMSASLVSMVADLSLRHRKYEAFQTTIESARDEARRLAAVMVRLADADAEAFSTYMAVTAMARTNDAEIASRQAAMAAAGAAAIEPPQAIVAACAEIAAACERLAGCSNLGLASDLVAAPRLVEGAAYGAMENVLVNLPALGDVADAEALVSKAVRSLRSTVSLARAVRVAVARHNLRNPKPARPGRAPVDARAGAMR